MKQDAPWSPATEEKNREAGPKNAGFTFIYTLTKVCSTKWGKIGGGGG
jgi:hypothetical protein